MESSTEKRSTKESQDAYGRNLASGFMRQLVVLTNARLLGRPETELAIAFDGSRIQDVGSPSKIRRTYRHARWINLNGATVLPGLTDTHCHLVALGRNLNELDLAGVNSIQELRRRLSKKIEGTRPRKWVVGRGWDQEKLADARYPTRHDIDDLSTKNPVVLSRICGHISLANTLALSLAGISRTSKDPGGGIIDRDSNGNPTGILRENAQELVLQKIPSTLRDTREAVIRAVKISLQKGLTKVHCILSHDYRTELQAFREVHRAGALKLRVRLYLPPEALEHLSKLRSDPGFRDGFLEIGGIKIFADGSLGARTAALSQPYSDDPSNHGVLIYSLQQLSRIVHKATRAGLQVAIHAIGDRAIRVALEAISGEKTAIQRLRPRIEHASVLSTSLVKAIKRLGVCISAQPRFAISDFWVGERVGQKRIRGVYALRTLVGARVVVGGSSDAPVEPLSPFEGIWAATTHTKKGEIERLPLNQAVKLYTENAAYLGFDEDARGKIAKNYRADFTVIAQDLADMREPQLRKTKPILAIVDGRVAFADKRALAGKGIVLPKALTR